MKYRDVVTVFLALAFFLSLGYALGVARSLVFWIVPCFFLSLLFLMYWYIWREN
ncbi:MAG: hypothetical protein R6V50_01505 [Thermoplasmatota archaeon]